MPEGRLLSPGAVAKLFGVDPRTVTRWVDKGMLAAILTPGGHRRYRYLDVMALRDRLAGGGAAAPAVGPATAGTGLAGSAPAGPGQAPSMSTDTATAAAPASAVAPSPFSAVPPQAEVHETGDTFPRQQPPIE
ncbi:MAG: MerR family DNA-binding transcriptional regulator [Actinobacteria bacterium]|nr:MerR family DNA-binding transcriptional regulator [Actinomycetota bacterium]